MPRICFVTYEIYPTTWGGCGVLLHHAAELLLQRGFEVTFLLDLAGPEEFERFSRVDRLVFTNPHNCRAFDVHALAADMPYSPTTVPSTAQFRSLRFAYALRKLLETEQFDYVEFFDYGGVAYHALVDRLYGADAGGPVLGIRLHNSMELIDRHGASRLADQERYRLYALEHGALELAETVLTPTQRYDEAHCRDLYRLSPERVVVSQSPKLDFPRVTRRPSASGEFNIVYVGRMFHFKGVDQLVHAAVLLFRRRPELRCRLEVIGPDSAESPFGPSQIETLRSMIPPDLRERFLFPGHLSHAQMAERLNEALFGVFANRFESFCYALHEVYDAGVPVIVNEIPGVGDFFKHEQNALMYDGTTEALVSAMERMIDDGAMRERLCRPYPIANQPLGDFYDRPQAFSPVIAAAGSAVTLRTLFVVLCPDGLDAAQRTLANIAAQTRSAASVVALVPATLDGEEVLWWLGQAWHVRAPDGARLAVFDLLTTDALAVLRSGDELQPDWLEFCARALERRPQMAFAGTWALLGDWCEPSFLDVAPEMYPLEHGPRLTRVLVRTQPGELLVDLYDPNLAGLGEIGYLWRAIARWGPGRLHPQPRLKLAGEPTQLVDTSLFQYLVASCGDAWASRWGLAAGVVEQWRQRDHHPGRDATLVAQTRMIDERDVALAAQTRMIDERDALIRKQDELVQARDQARAQAAAELQRMHADLRRPRFCARALAVAMYGALRARPRE
jgi:glycosyltransferase involved in cell wall biosynthesis